MAPRRCCCNIRCAIGDDDFDRADSADPGPKWRILSGEASIASNRIVVDGVVATTFCHPLAYPLGSYIAEMLLVGMSDGSVSFWEVYIGDPSSPSYRVEVSHNSGTNEATLKLYAGATLIHSETYSGVTTNQTLRVCYAPGMMVSAFLGGFIPHIDHCDGSVGATCFAATGGVDVGGFAFKAGTFDNWTYDVHYIENQNCEACSCFCWRTYLDEDGVLQKDYSCFPAAVTLTFESVGADAATIDDIVLYQSFGSPVTPWPNKQEGWNSDVVNCGLPIGAEFAFRFECDNPITGMLLTPLSKDYDTTLGGQIVWSWVSGAAPTNSARNATDASTCDPLSIVFPEIKINSAFPGPGCDFGDFPSGGHQPYCGSLKDTCFASEPDIRFIPRIIV
jgi:hypothetical protein